MSTLSKIYAFFNTPGLSSTVNLNEIYIKKKDKIISELNNIEINLELLGNMIYNKEIADKELDELIVAIYRSISENKFYSQMLFYRYRLIFGSIYGSLGRNSKWSIDYSKDYIIAPPIIWIQLIRLAKEYDNPYIFVNNYLSINGLLFIQYLIPEIINGDGIKVRDLSKTEIEILNNSYFIGLLQNLLTFFLFPLFKNIMNPFIITRNIVKYINQRLDFEYFEMKCRAGPESYTCGRAIGSADSTYHPTIRIIFYNTVSEYDDHMDELYLKKIIKPKQSAGKKSYKKSISKNRFKKKSNVRKWYKRSL